VRDREAVQGADGAAGRERVVGGGGRGPRALRVEGDDRVDGRVEPVDPLEVGVEQLARGELARTQQPGQLGFRPPPGGERRGRGTMFR
jgi:hypothetical protein